MWTKALCTHLFINLILLNGRAKLFLIGGSDKGVHGSCQFSISQNMESSYI